MKKLYYTIGEVSKQTGVEPHILRYWESLFRELNPSKNRAGKRVYKESDIETVHLLKDLIQKNKYSTAGARKALDRMKKEPDTQQASTEIPDAVRQDLKEARNLLEDLLQKI
ncbi:MerR family transcriptional regulator [Balneolaceae bacterium ANBcel3]|nr:MerR family transcriptional regulator [Balneolaceae bacterium ANBcel3]